MGMGGIGKRNNTASAETQPPHERIFTAHAPRLLPRMKAGDSVGGVFMAVPKHSLIQECSTCGALLDVSGEEPFALMHCPTCGAAMRVRRLFDHFEIQEELGAGGMGTVYRALDLTLNRPVALKLLHREHSGNPGFVAQFQKEAAITASINHPHVVKVYSTGQDTGLLYIAMELVDKGSLERVMGSGERAFAGCRCGTRSASRSRRASRQRSIAD